MKLLLLMPILCALPCVAQPGTYPITFACKATDNTKAICGLVKVSLLTAHYRITESGGLGSLYLQATPHEEKAGDAKRHQQPSYHLQGWFSSYSGRTIIDMDCTSNSDIDCTDAVADTVTSGR